MATYKYTAIIDGKTKRGTIEANSEDRAMDKLKGEGYMVTKLAEAGAMDKDINISIGGKVKAKDLTMFCKQFSSILNAGVTIIMALDMLAEQGDNKTLKDAIKAMQVSVEKGNNLADSMRMHPKVFPEILVNMVEAGEASGSLEIALVRMADHFEKDNRMQAQIKSAMTYPIIVLCVAVAVVIVCMVFVIPNFTSMFADMDMDLPMATKIMVAASDFIREKWYILVAVVVAVVVVVKFFKKTSTGEYLFAKMAMKLPLIGNLTIKSSAARFARTLSTLMASGIQLIDAVESVAKVMTNRIIKENLMNARDQVAKGVPLSKPIKDMGIFPPLLTQMVHIGEETGNLEDMMFRVADFFDEEVDEATKALTAAMEPLIMVFLAGIVGMIVAAVYGPMLSMYEGMDDM
jgi:type IV pilus assembly protein PilC